MSNIKFSQLPDLGNITAATIVPVVESGVNYTVTTANLQAYVNSTTGNVTAGNVSATGNIAGNYILGNGSQLTGLPATYNNANVTTLLSSFGSNNISTTGNVTAGQFIGNGSQLTGIVSSYGNGNVTTLLANLGSNAVSTTGNVTAGFLFGDGSQITNLPTGNYSNANVAAYLPTYTGNITANTISATGNVTGAFLLGNISGATGGYGNANVQAVLQTYTGTMTAGSLSTTGNVTGNFFVGNGSALTGITATLGGTMTSNIAGVGFSINGLGTLGANTVTATGNVTAANITGTMFGNGSNLSGIPTSIVAGTGISVSAATGAVTITNNNPNPYSNANVAAYLPTYTGVVAAANVSATGTIVGGAVSATGTVSGTNFVGNGAGLSNIVTSITAGSGISINSSTGAVTITATGGSGSSGKVAGSVATGAYYSTVEGISGSVLIPAGTFVTGDVVEIFAQWLNNSGTTQQRFAQIYINTVNSIPAASQQIWGGILSANGNQFTKNALRLEIVNSSNTRGFFPAGALAGVATVYADGLGSAPSITATTYNINWTVNQYIIFTTKNANGSGSESAAVAGYQIYKR